MHLFIIKQAVLAAVSRCFELGQTSSLPPLITNFGNLDLLGRTNKAAFVFIICGIIKTVISNQNYLFMK